MAVVLRGDMGQKLDQSIYGKYPLNPQKIATKGFSMDSVRFECTF